MILFSFAACNRDISAIFDAATRTPSRKSTAGARLGDQKVDAEQLSQPA